MFQSKKRKSLENVIRQIRVDLANNYKDNAIENLKKLKDETEAAVAKGELKPKEVEELKGMIEAFETDVKNFKRTY
jgi:benzoyl-CoA reductase/2-hydroxyglutaryl-CoA dehydratase subunit BcrC/BadD/HgdB